MRRDHGDARAGSIGSFERARGPRPRADRLLIAPPCRPRSSARQASGPAWSRRARPGPVLRGRVWRLFTWVLFELDPLGLIFAAPGSSGSGSDLVDGWGPGRSSPRYLGLAEAAGARDLPPGPRIPWSAAARSCRVPGRRSSALIIAWATYFPGRDIFVYFVLPLAGRNLIYATLGGTLLFALLSGSARFVPHFAAQLLMLASLRGTPLSAALRRGCAVRVRVSQLAAPASRLKAVAPPRATRTPAGTTDHRPEPVCALGLRACSPKIAVPTLTIVAPSSIATSKSWLMPMDSSEPAGAAPPPGPVAQLPQPPEVGPRLLRVLGEGGQDHEARARGGLVRPRSASRVGNELALVQAVLRGPRRPGRPGRARRSVRRSLGRRARASFRPSARPSTEWMRSNSAAARRALLDCRWPTRCQRRPCCAERGQWPRSWPPPPGPCSRRSRAGRRRTPRARARRDASC